MIVSLVTSGGVTVVILQENRGGSRGQLITQRLSEEEVMRRKEAEERKEIELREKNLQWLRTEGLPKLEQFTREENWTAAWGVAQEARERFPDDSKVRQLCDDVSCNWTVITEPVGAKFSRRHFEAADGPWLEAGETPIHQFTSEKGMFLWKLELDGFEAVEGLAGPQNVGIRRTLPKKGEAPGMVFIESVAPSGQKTTFWIDRCEVTNDEYKEFINAGGYREQKYWVHPIIRNGSQLPWNDAVKTFTDSTGEPGPSLGPMEPTEAVRTSSQCEEFVGMRPPRTPNSEARCYPQSATGKRQQVSDQYAHIVPASNFTGYGPAAVGAHDAMGFFGVLDMAGNVKEWCWNRTAEGYRTMRGGAWNEPGYMFQLIERFAPCERKPTFGFRCAKYVTSAQPKNWRISVAQTPDASPMPDPLSQKELEQLMTVFRYDKDAPLNGRTISIDDGAESHRHETIQIDAAYNGERLNLHLFLPKGVPGPFQTLVYFPGIGAIPLRHFDDATKLIDSLIPLGLVGQGRAVCWPVYKGTFERNDGYGLSLTPFQQLEFNKQMVKDLRRAVDYLSRARLGYEPTCVRRFQLGREYRATYDSGGVTLQGKCLNGGSTSSRRS